MKTVMPWYHLGLRGRLFTAFGVVAALTVLASSSAIISYGSLGRSLGAVTDKSLPEITRTSKVVKAAGEVAAAAPGLLAATDPVERERAFKVLAAARQELTQTISALGLEDAAKITKTADRILANLDRLVVVACRPEQRIERWARRLKMDEETARREVARRMAAQLPDEEKIKAADYVIDNSGSLDETRRQVEDVYGVLKKEAES